MSSKAVPRGGANTRQQQQVIEEKQNQQQEEESEYDAEQEMIKESGDPRQIFLEYAAANDDAHKSGGGFAGVAK